ncbi:MAG: queuosine salvage family protein [Candidatus Saccharimonas sp.]
MERASNVSLHDDRLTELAVEIDARLARGTDEIEVAFGTTGLLERDVNLVFFETAVNFCFWSDLDSRVWMLERGGQRLGGWYSLAACFDRAVANGIPVYEAQYMANLTEVQARELFVGVDGIDIPLLSHRVRNLNQTGRYLLEKHKGQAVNMLASVGFSAPRLAELVANELASFRDGAVYAGRWVWILKRAQILGSDLSQLANRYPSFHIEDCDQLTAFADYRLPQVLRYYGVIHYTDTLARRVDSGKHLEAGSSSEVEIRAATIVACEKLKQRLSNHTSADIDLGLWLLSQDMRSDPMFAPHHRTLGLFY